MKCHCLSFFLSARTVMDLRLQKKVFIFRKQIIVSKTYCLILGYHELLKCSIDLVMALGWMRGELLH